MGRSMLSRVRTHLCLLACLAVLFNLLVMPLDRSLRTPAVDQSLILGSFCSLHGLQSLPKSLLEQLRLDPSELSDHGDGKLQAGDCCCGHAGQALLAGDYFKHLFPRFWPAELLSGHVPTLRLPREQWPNLNPRASPLA